MPFQHPASHRLFTGLGPIGLPGFLTDITDHSYAFGGVTTEKSKVIKVET